MKKIRCLTCKTELSNEAQVCPMCGKSIERVKPWLAVLLSILAGIIVFLMILFGGINLMAR